MQCLPAEACLALQAWRKKPGAEPQLLSLEQQRAELTTVEVLRPEAAWPEL